MRTRLILALMLAVAIGIFGSVSGALATPIWSIGTIHNGGVSPIVGASEYPATNAFSSQFVYDVNNADPFDSNPSCPGYIADKSLGDILIDLGQASDPRPRTDATQELIIRFTPDIGLVNPQLTYYRYGSESDVVKLDGSLLAPIGTLAEGAFRQFTFSLADLSAVQHEISIAYNFGGTDNGHYIDYLRLDATPIPEPATMLLLGTGLVGLAGFRRKFKK